MRINELLWPHDRNEHIARHSVTPDEVEEVCFGQSLILRAKSQGENPVYYVLGQTDAGRYLFSVIIQFPAGQRLSCNCSHNGRQGRAPLQAMESEMKTEALPQTDSIQELAQ